MPCDIGYRTTERVTIPVPQPQEFALATKAPDIDADLLKKLGEEDPQFLGWLRELNTFPLLQAALKRALRNVNTNGIDFTIGTDGALKATGSFITAAEKDRMQKTAEAVSDRWQFEILGIVVRLLKYDVVIREEDGMMILEAMEEGKSHPCDYIKVTRQDGNSTLTFEHFKTKKALEVGIAKFLSLAERMGIKIALSSFEAIEGRPFPIHERTHAHNHTHGHTHNHSH